MREAGTVKLRSPSADRPQVVSEPSSHCYVVGALGAGGIVPLEFEFMSCFMYGLKLLTKAILELRFTINC